MLKQQRVICFPGRPAAGLAVSFTAGTFAGLQLHSVFVSTVVLIAVSAAALILLRLGRRYRIAFNAAVAATHALVASAACFSAAIAIAGRTRDYSPLWEMLAADERVSISGTVITEPYGQRFERGGACVSFTLKVKSIPDDFGGVNPNPFNLQVECFGPPSQMI